MEKMKTESTKTLCFLTGIILPAVLLIAMLLCLASCNKTDTVTGSREKVTIVYTESAGSALVHIAVAKGYLTEEGLDVTPQSHAFGKTAIEAVIGGKADLAVASDTAIMFAVMGGQRITTLAVIATSNKNMAILARKDDGLSRPADLRGKTIGVVRGTVSDFFADVFLTSHGIDRKRVEIIDLQPDEMAAALGTGKVDAVSIWQPNLIQLQKDIGNGGQTFFGEAFYTFALGVTASQDFVMQHPEAVRKILRALIRAENFAKEYPEESQRLVAKFLKTDKAFMGEIWGVYDYRISLNQGFLFDLEDQSRWAMKQRLTAQRHMPNYLDFIYVNGLQAVKPEAVSIIR